MATSDLTARQEAFALAYVETRNASEAYRRAYDASGMKPETLSVEACRTLAHAKVAARVMALEEEARERNAVTVDTLTAKLEEARAHAMKDDKGASAAVSAVMGVAKLHGLLIDRTDLVAKVDVRDADVKPIDRAKAIALILMRGKTALDEMFKPETVETIRVLAALAAYGKEMERKAREGETDG